MALRGQNTQANTTTSASVVITHGISIQSGDIIILTVSGGGGNANTFTWPSGFGAISGLTNIGLEPSGGNTCGINYKVAGGSEPSTYTVSSSVTDFLTLHIRVYSGRNTSAPFTNTQQTARTAWTGSGKALTGLTAASGDDIVFIAQYSNDGNGYNTFVAPSGFSNGLQIGGVVTFSPAAGVADFVNNSGGATGSLGFNQGGSSLPTFYGGYALSLAAAPQVNPLIGQTTPISGNTIGLLTSDIYWVTSNAFAGGVANALNVCLGPTNVPGGLLLGLFDLNGNLLASGSVATPAAGLNTATISNTNIVYGQQYSISVQATAAGSNYNVSGNPTGTGPIHAANTPNTMPSTLPGSPFVDTHGLMTLYATGSLNAGASGTPLGGPARTSWHWRSSGGTS